MIPTGPQTIILIEVDTLDGKQGTPNPWVFGPYPCEVDDSRLEDVSSLLLNALDEASGDTPLVYVVGYLELIPPQDVLHLTEPLADAILDTMTEA